MFSARFWLQTFASVIITMILIVIVKKVSTKYNIPFLGSLANEV